MSTPSQASRRPSSGWTACAVHSLTAKSSPQRSDRRSKRSVDDRVVVQGRDGVEVLRVPRRVVAIDETGDVHARHHRASSGPRGRS
jgi:hypothetical protein